MPATPIYALPFPAPSDPADVPLDMQELAERIALVLGGIPSATPPATPFEGQLWYLPVDVPAGCIWTFRYNAASASAYKWEFVGGASLRFASLVNAVLNTLTQVGGSGHFYDSAATQTVPRAGDYEITGQMVFDANGSPGQPQVVGFHGVNLASWDFAPTHVDTSVNARGTAAGFWLAQGVAAGAKVGLAGGGTAPNIHKLTSMAGAIRPSRVS